MIRIEFYAQLRDEAQVEFTEVEFVGPATQLWEQMKSQYSFSLDSHMLSVAVNDEFAPWDVAISAGDKVVFIPPVAGG